MPVQTIIASEKLPHIKIVLVDFLVGYYMETIKPPSIQQILQITHNLIINHVRLIIFIENNLPPQ